jgi:hypothetical protein
MSPYLAGEYIALWVLSSRVKKKATQNQPIIYEMVIKIVIIIAKSEEYFRILGFGYLSLKNPAGVNSRINGKRIKAFTIAVNIINSDPLYALKIVFCRTILCPKSVIAFKKTITI